jgi:hypothetical protein
MPTFSREEMLATKLRALLGRNYSTGYPATNGRRPGKCGNGLESRYPRTLLPLCGPKAVWLRLTLQYKVCHYAIAG